MMAAVTAWEDLTPAQREVIGPALLEAVDVLCGTGAHEGHKVRQARKVVICSCGQRFGEGNAAKIMADRH
jgi:hypothetical protein